MRKLFSFLIFTACACTASAQSAEDSVKMIVNKMFTAMKTSDATMLSECVADSAIFQTIAKNKEGKVSVRTENVADFAKHIATAAKGDLDERITLEAVKVDADLVSVWTHYSFYYKGNFSHCGVNSFQLVRVKGEWRIQYIIDTRRKGNCK